MQRAEHEDRETTRTFFNVGSHVSRGKELRETFLTDRAFPLDSEGSEASFVKMLHRYLVQLKMKLINSRFHLERNNSKFQI